MTDLTPMTALGGQSARVQTLGTLSLSETPDLALASLSLRRGAVQPVPMGLPLPGPGGWTAGQGLSAFWTGPGQWMIEAPGRAETGIEQALKQAAPDCSVTDQTDGFAAIEITSGAGGAPIRALLEKLVNLDAAGFGPGSATRTGLEHMTVFVIRRAEDRLALIGMRSLAGSLWHAVERAAQQLQEGTQ